MSTYTQYSFYTDPSHFEILIAFLAQYEFESFQEEDEMVLGWIQTSKIPTNFEQEVQELIPVSFTITKEEIEDQNWNAQWESQFEPVIVSNFCCIRADFHEATPNVQYDIVINPKMAFGTGHHETTEMMVRRMSEIDIQGKTIFDFGTGTGILAILANKMGAGKTIGIDNDTNATENARENIKTNHTPSILISDDDISQFAEQSYDILLGNVNRNAILSNLIPMTDISNRIIISGILLEDKDLILDSFRNQNYSPLKILNKGEWLCIDFLKNT